MIQQPESQLQNAATAVGKHFKQSPYYDRAENGFQRVWGPLVYPFIEGVDFTITMDLAAGHGRNSAKLLPLVEKLFVVDINVENIEFCRKRFSADQSRVEFYVNDGYSLPFLTESSLTFVYCFDAMVHFDSDVVRSYLLEFRRVVRPGGKIFCHHSNYTGNPMGAVHENPGWRNFMSKDLFSHYATKAGLRVVKQEIIDWHRNGTNMDCFSMLENSDS